MGYEVLLKEINEVLKGKNTEIALLKYQVQDLKNKVEQMEQKNVESEEEKSA
jgi:uncharacterized coiled-coil protein SlyX